MEFFAPCPRGFEPLLAEELRAIGARSITPGVGGVAFAGDQQVMMRANLMSRIASRVLVRIATGRLPHDQPQGKVLYQLAREVAWHEWLTPDDRLRVDVTALIETRDALSFLTLRVKDGVCDAMRAHFGRRPNVDKAKPTVRLVAHLTPGQAMLYWDTSGAPLYQRGFKQAKVAAPLKEHLAAAVLQTIGWPSEAPLLDPMCGSATLLLEGVLLAARAAPGVKRAFAFEHWRGLEQSVWQRLRAEVWAESRAGLLQLAGRRWWGSDIDPRAVEAAKTNWAALTEAFEVPLAAEWEVAAAEALEPPAATGVWVANPPYGVRLADEKRLATWYPVLGNALKRRWAGWTAHFLSADPQFPKRFGLRPARRARFKNGALDCQLLSYPLVVGGLKQPKQ